MINHPKRNTYLSKHHLIPKSRNGTLKKNNTLMLWRDNHDCWHCIFDNKTLVETISFLHNSSNELKRKTQSKYWKKLFKEKSIKEIVSILKRVKRIKSKL